ncbi:uncharacterized protein CLUP02_15080 [Colletotrichum lupini]|uniref:Uncharacterized protein n=1 Tax=Colletotrichum lupini TaxID=145971 RepID=A0A9Q8T595_9PEZI|nr:uncharacterized protein CLUP02_15080 [Colletotrichum lupini]UQC89549.1 hypothetical protein CLUP02_15080 [Colletotrichum lupini]
MVDNMELGRNDLTRDFQTVVAKVILPFRFRSAVHGNWVDATRIAGAEPYDVQSFEDIYPHIPTVGPDSSSKVNEQSQLHSSTTERNMGYRTIGIFINKPEHNSSGVERWAHNPEVPGSKPGCANKSFAIYGNLFLLSEILCFLLFWLEKQRRVAATCIQYLQFH